MLNLDCLPVHLGVGGKCCSALLTAFAAPESVTAWRSHDPTHDAELVARIEYTQQLLQPTPRNTKYDPQIAPPHGQHALQWHQEKRDLISKSGTDREQTQLLPLP